MLNRPQKKLPGEKGYRRLVACTICDRSFSNKRHYATHHPEEVIPPKVVNPKRKTKTCPLPGCAFSGQRLDVHLKSGTPSNGHGMGPEEAAQINKQTPFDGEQTPTPEGSCFGKERKFSEKESADLLIGCKSYLEELLEEGGPKVKQARVVGTLKLDPEYLYLVQSKNPKQLADKLRYFVKIEKKLRLEGKSLYH